MIKQVLLAVGMVALYLAAKEYGINSLDDLKDRMASVLRFVKIDELTAA